MYGVRSVVLCLCGVVYGCALLFVLRFRGGVAFTGGRVDCSAIGSQVQWDGHCVQEGGGWHESRIFG